MSGVSSLSRALDALDQTERVHYDRLLAGTALLADISFADILMLLPAADHNHSDGDGRDRRFIVTAHNRPITSPTVHPNDLVGREISPAERPLCALALRTGVSTNGGVYLRDHDRWVQSLAVPVSHRDRTIAVLLREFPAVSERVWGRLETTYFSLFRRLAGMIADGVYPYATTPDDHDHPPRLGDGLILLNARSRVEYLTPNAQSALRRLGVNSDPTGRFLAQVGIEPRAIRLTAAMALPHTEEIERNGHSVVVRCLPLIQEDTLTGILVLVRDITELRRVDRLLITKEAALAEVHHRVKNNLQTVSSLLSLQSRWLEVPEAKAALAESARRIRLIASVHEILSGPKGESTPFEDVVASLSSLLRESLIPPHAPIAIRVEGTMGPLPSEVMTTLAIVLNELVQNAVDHGFGAGDGAGADGASSGRVRVAANDGSAGLPGGNTPSTPPAGNDILVRLSRRQSELRLSVTDNGAGLPEGPLPEGLGLTLVRTLVENDLSGRIVHWSSPGGTTVELTAYLGERAPARGLPSAISSSAASIPT